MSNKHIKAMSEHPCDSGIYTDNLCPSDAETNIHLIEDPCQADTDCTSSSQLAVYKSTEDHNSQTLPIFGKIFCETPIQKLLTEQSEMKRTQHGIQNEIDAMSGSMYTINKTLHTLQNLLQMLIETNLCTRYTDRTKEMTSKKVPAEVEDIESEYNDINTSYRVQVEADLNPDPKCSDETEYHDDIGLQDSNTPSESAHLCEAINHDHISKTENPKINYGLCKPRVQCDTTKLLEMHKSGNTAIKRLDFVGHRDQGITKQNRSVIKLGNGYKTQKYESMPLDINEREMDVTESIEPAFSGRSINVIDKAVENIYKDDFCHKMKSSETNIESVKNEGEMSSVEHPIEKGEEKSDIVKEEINEDTKEDKETGKAKLGNELQNSVVCMMGLNDTVKLKQLRKIPNRTKCSKGIKKNESALFTKNASNKRQNRMATHTIQVPKMFQGKSILVNNISKHTGEPMEDRSALYNTRHIITLPVASKRRKANQVTKDRQTGIHHNTSYHDVPKQGCYNKNTTKKLNIRPNKSFPGRKVRKRSRHPSASRSKFKTRHRQQKSRANEPCMSKREPYSHQNFRGHKSFGVRVLLLLLLFLLAVVKFAFASDGKSTQHDTQYQSPPGMSYGFVVYMEVDLQMLLKSVGDLVSRCWNYPLDLYTILQLMFHCCNKTVDVHYDSYIVCLAINILVFSYLTILQKKNCGIAIQYKEEMIFSRFLPNTTKVKECFKILQHNQPMTDQSDQSGYYLRTTSLPVLYGSMTLEYLAEREKSRLLEFILEEVS